VSRYGPDLSLEKLLFFDLETTGLSHGAGTVAFLAALGRFDREDTGRGSKRRTSLRLRVDQYLLLDYPGEIPFLEALLPELDSGDRPLVVTYNGKSFDAQILKTQCLMNGFKPPDYAQADLLHPARRLWKRVLPTCSQGQIETALLGLDRTGDTPGALAPDIWFSFLKTGEAGPLLGICDHNVKDIYGLARLFFALTEIAAAPLEAGEKYRCDFEALALYWRKRTRRYGPAAFGEGAAETGAALLDAASARGFLQARYVSARDLLRGGRHEAALEGLTALAERAKLPPNLAAAVYRTLAVDAEHRRKDRRAALAYTEAALARNDIGEGPRKDLNRRRERLLVYLAKEEFGVCGKPG
jgi:uncharacterized protein YprB with RNaseH-like and TPR domain